MTGQVIDISPDGLFSGQNGTKASGITFTFASPVNAHGVEVGDWATCYFNPTTDLFISFDGAAAIKVASASTETEGQLLPNSRVHEIFVAAFDDTGDFSKVEFWGNGSGEFLVIGGTIKYALLDEGNLPVPEPTTMALLGLSLIGQAATRRRKAA